MTPATAKRLTAAIGLPLLCMLLLLLLAAFTAGCSGDEASTTTTVKDTTSTTEPEETTTSSTEEEITTTTTDEFPPTVTHDQMSSRFVYSGKWNTVSASSASGQSIAVANSSGASLTIRFYGVACSWIAKLSPAYGKAEVTVDGGAAKTVDLYSAETVWKKKIWRSGTLPLDDHTVVISWTGDKTSGATGTNINIDSIVVAGVLTGTFEEDNTKLTYDGTWKTAKNSSSSGGSIIQADASGASVTIKFSGVRLVWLGRLDSGNGQANVSLDGGPDSTVDLYGSTTQSTQTLWDTGVLELGDHTVKITWSGEKSASSSGTAINVDAFEVTGALE